MSAGAIAIGRRSRRRRSRIAVAGLSTAALVVFLLSLMIGDTFYGPATVARVISGENVVGASFTVGELRLPRAVLGVLSGWCLGIAGATFQTMLRNPLASPDVIGVSYGASAAAVIGIVMLSLDDTAISLLALTGALATAVVLYLLANRGGFAGARFVLIGVGFAAMLQSVVSYVLSRAQAWDMQTAMRWLSASLNGATWQRVSPLAAITAVVATALVLSGSSLVILQLGDDSAAALGVNVRRTRLVAMMSAVILLAFATAASGPISFVAFMAGPIATRLVGPGAALLVPAGLVGTLLVLGSDLAAQNAFDHRYPVGVVTGLLGAPYLIALLVRTNHGASL